MDEHGEIADLLRHRVGDDCNGCRDAELRIGEKGGSDDDAVAEVMHAGADQDHEPRSTLVRAAVHVQRVGVLGFFRVVDVEIVSVGVAPQHELLQQEKGEQADQHGDHHALRSPSSSACGSNSRNTAPRRAPTANETSREIHDGWSASVPAAAPVASTPPARAATTI